MARHPVATVCSHSAPWIIPVLGIGLFLHKHFIADVSSTNPADARFKAVARCRNAPKGQRRVRRRPSPIVEANIQTDTIEEQLQQQERELTDAVLGNDTVYEWFNEDEVEALQQAQAQANPQALLGLLHQYGSRMAAEGYIQDEDDQDSDGSLWYTDEQEHSWQQDSHSSSSPQQQQDSTQTQAHVQQQQDAGQQFLRHLAAAQQQQQDGVQQGADRTASKAGSVADAGGEYFDDSYFGLPADESAAPRDLQELQAAVSKNLEALLPKDTTWSGSYPPRFDEVLSPADAGGYIHPGSERGYIDRGDEAGGYIGPAPEFDFDLDPGFDYVPDFDYDPDFDPDFDDDMLDMFDFDIEP